MSRANRNWIRALLAVLLAVLAPAAAAAPCAGFADVDTSSPFCASVAWIKNQGITVGCGDGTIYCPNEPVSRLGMAAFLKRTADAIGDAATAQPYAYTLNGTCGAAHQCTGTFPVVPAGKRLRLTNVRVVQLNAPDANGVLAVHRTMVALANLQVIFAVNVFPGATYGNVLAGSHAVDLTFTEGEFPVLELAIPVLSGTLQPALLKFGVSGYFVDVAP